ncbi:MAG TPA: hypothetical protein VK436_02680 [Methanocella sp.]|nr:hypothetical protein [Methanocella sp.]
MSIQINDIRLKKTAPYVLIGLLIMAAGLIIYSILPRPIGQSMVLLSACLLAGVFSASIGLYLFMVGKDSRSRSFTGKRIGASVVIAGLVIMASGPFYYYISSEIFSTSPDLSIGFLVIPSIWGLVATIVGLLIYLKEAKKTFFDERSRNTIMKAGFYSFFTYLFLLGGLAIVQTAGIVNIGYGRIVWLIWFFMPWTFLLFWFILDRKGEDL